MNTTTNTLLLGRPGRGITHTGPSVAAGEVSIFEFDPKADHRRLKAAPASSRRRTRRSPIRRGLRTLGLSTWILLACGGTAWAQGTVSGTGGRGGGSGGGGVPDLAQNASDNTISVIQLLGVAALAAVLCIPLIKAAANKKFGEVLALLLVGGLVGMFVMDPEGTITTVQTFAKQFSS